MALLPFTYGTEQGRLLSSTPCALWTSLRVLEGLSISSKPMLCVHGGGHGEEALKVCDFSGLPVTYFRFCTHQFLHL